MEYFHLAQIWGNLALFAYAWIYNWENMRACTVLKLHSIQVRVVLVQIRTAIGLLEQS